LLKEFKGAWGNEEEEDERIKGLFEEYRKRFLRNNTKT